MTAGFQAFTDTGVFQIDGLTPVFGVSFHQVVTTQNGSLLFSPGIGAFQYVTVPLVSITFSAGAPVVAFYSPNAPCAMMSCQPQGGNVWTAQFYTTVPTQIEVYVFDSMASIGSSAGFGLEVFNEQGALIADAATPMMRPLQYLAGVANNKSDGWQQSGGPYAESQSWGTNTSKVATGAVVTAAYSGNNLWISCWQHAGGVATYNFDKRVHSGAYNADNNFVGYGSSMHWSGLLIDVSGI